MHSKIHYKLTYSWPFYSKQTKATKNDQHIKYNYSD